MRRLPPAVPLALLAVLCGSAAPAQTPAKPAAPAALTFPPKLPDGKTVITETSDLFLKPPAEFPADVAVARTPPTIDILFYPGQDYPGRPWSNWGDSVAVNGKYYASIGDHLAVGGPTSAPGRTGTGMIFEYDPVKKSFRELVNTAKLLNLPEGHYTPGKIHSRIDMGSDGWLYFATHRGSTTVTTDKNHYEGDWIIRCDPKTGKSEVVAHGPVPKHCIPNSVLDPDRMIFYGSTAPGVGKKDEEGIHFFAYDAKNRKMLYDGPNGPARYFIFARSTGRVYYVPGSPAVVGKLMRYDPAAGGAPVPIEAELSLRAATQETPQGLVYAVSQESPPILYSFNTKTEEAKKLGEAAVGQARYTTTIDADPTGRYLYYVPGGHGGSEKDGAAVIQYDTKTNKKKVIAFLHPYFKDRCATTLMGTYSTAVDPAGDKLYVTWNAARGVKGWDCCALTVIHIPATERP